MKKKTLAVKFKAKAKLVMLTQDDLLDLDDSIDSESEIDEIMFHKGEYIGGMAAVILSLLRMDNGE